MVADECQKRFECQNLVEIVHHKRCLELRFLLLLKKINVLKLAPFVIINFLHYKDLNQIIIKNLIFGILLCNTF